MGKQKKIRKFAEMKRLLNPKDLKSCVAALLHLKLTIPSASAKRQCSKDKDVLESAVCLRRQDKTIKKDSDKQVKHM